MTVVKIGGSIIFEDNEIVGDRILETVQTIRKYSSTIDGIVVGGGDLARQYISVGKNSGLDSDKLDLMGINATHSNAKFLNLLLNEKYEFRTELTNIDKGENIITGGTKPGHTTDAVAVMLAEKTGSDTVYSLSDIDGIYDTRDCPLEDADRIDSATVSYIKQIIDKQTDSPGRSIPIDRTAVDRIANTGITYIMFDGTNTKNLENALKGVSVGTTINP